MINLFAKSRKIEIPLKILVLADFHQASDEDFLAVQNITSPYDMAVFLGDIRVSFLKAFKECLRAIPIYGILGNHDGMETLKLAEIENINGKLIEINGVKLVGMQGSFRYKQGDYPMFTQEESLQFVKTLPLTDVLLSHDSPYKLYGDNSAHIGLKGISQYIKKNKVPLNIHGHQHVNKVNDVKGTKVIGVYRAAIVDAMSGQVEVVVDT